MRRVQRKPAKLRRFTQLAEKLEAASWQLKSDWKPILSAMKAEHEEALLVDAEKLRARLNRAALQWIATDIFPAMTAKEVFLLRLRFIAAWHLLYQLELENGTTVFTISRTSDAKFLAWLLNKWGHEVGTVEGLGHEVSSWKAKGRLPK